LVLKVVITTTSFYLCPLRRFTLSLLDLPGFQISLRKHFKSLFRKVLDGLPAWVIYDQSELVDNDSLRLRDGYLDPNNILCKDPDVERRNCGGVWPEGEEWIREVLAGIIGRRHFTSSKFCFSRFVVTLLNDCEMCFAWRVLEPER
jgi:hypothetical protein